MGVHELAVVVLELVVALEAGVVLHGHLLALPVGGRAVEHLGLLLHLGGVDALVVVGLELVDLVGELDVGGGGQLGEGWVVLDLVAIRLLDVFNTLLVWLHLINMFLILLI